MKSEIENESAEPISIWLIHCRTGCTCCSYENHYRGPYRTKDDADRRVASFLDAKSEYWPLGSQYAPRGKYVVYPCTAEPISGGRFIVHDRVLRELHFVDVAEDGSVFDTDGERFNALDG